MVAITDTGHWFGTERQRYSAASVIKATSGAPPESQNVCTLYSFLLSFLVFCLLFFFFCFFFFFFVCLFFSSEYHFVERNNVLSDSRIKRFCFVKRFVYCLFLLLFANSNNISGEKDPAFGLSREICCCFIVFTCRFLSTTTFPLPN